MIHIHYFGPIREQLNCASESITWQAGLSTDDVLQLLRARGAPWHTALAAQNVFKVALNQTILHASAPVPQGAQIGILPPVTGG
jgi:molybdopterin synthase sulfur carrier subunit